MTQCPLFSGRRSNAVEFVSSSILPGDLGVCSLTNTVYAVGEVGTIIRSDDFGLTWAPLPQPDGYTGPLYGVSFATPCVGYVVGAQGKVFRTIDGGQFWRPVTVVGGSGETFYDVTTWGSGVAAVLVGQNGGVYEKSGTQFVKQTLGSLTVTDALFDVEAFDSGAALRICGDLGTVLFRDGGTWTRPWAGPHGPYYKMAFQSPTHGFAIGENFMIAEYE